MLKGKTIEEIVNKWSTDLETHVREFNKFAGEVAVWGPSSYREWKQRMCSSLEVNTVEPYIHYS